VWTLVIIILEVGMLRCLRRTCRCKSRIQAKEDLNLDEDVIEEEQKVERYINEHKGIMRKNSSLKNSYNNLEEGSKL